MVTVSTYFDMNLFFFFNLLLLTFRSIHVQQITESHQSFKEKVISIFNIQFTISIKAITLQSISLSLNL